MGIAKGIVSPFGSPARAQNQPSHAYMLRSTGFNPSRRVQIVVLLLLAASGLLSGCATGYQKMTAFTITGGFREKDLGKNVWRVEFGGNGYTSIETAQCFWLYRCAELALEKGFDGFEILSDIRLTKAVDPHEAFGLPQPRFQKAQYYVPIMIPMNDSNKPHLLADILLLKAPVTAAPPRTFDAHKLKAALEPHVAEPMKSRGNVKPHIHEYLLPENKLNPGI